MGNNKNSQVVSRYLDLYLRERPMFLSLIRAKEAAIFSDYLPLKKPVLDIGVGDGFFAKTVFGQVDYGIDIAGSRMKEARQLGVYRKLLTYDGVHIPLPDRSIATAVSNCVLEHVVDIGGLLREVHRVLVPGGRFLTTVMAAPWEDHLFGTKILGDFYKKWMRKKQAHVNVFTVGRWDKLFLRGFSIVEKTGYLTPGACSIIDIAHYLSVPSLITYHIFGSWALLPQLLPLRREKLVSLLSENINSNQAGAIFYSLEKISTFG